MRHLQNSAAAALWPFGDTEGTFYKEHGGLAREARLQFCKLLAPYVDWGEQADVRTDIERERERWERFFGKMDDPDVQRRIREATEEFDQKVNESREQARREAELAAQAAADRDRSERAFRTTWKERMAARRTGP